MIITVLRSTAWATKEGFDNGFWSRVWVRRSKWTLISNRSVGSFASPFPSPTFAEETQNSQTSSNKIDNIPYRADYFSDLHCYQQNSAIGIVAPWQILLYGASCALYLRLRSASNSWLSLDGSQDVFAAWTHGWSSRRLAFSALPTTSLSIDL